MFGGIFVEMKEIVQRCIPNPKCLMLLKIHILQRYGIFFNAISTEKHLLKEIQQVIGNSLGKNILSVRYCQHNFSFSI